MASAEDVDSLFEGMVLFHPSQIQIQPDNQQHDPSTSNQIDVPVPTISTAAAATTTTTITSTFSTSSQPLDENLFSDLTLVTPLQNPEVAAPAELDPQSQFQSVSENASITPTPARQSSTRKKKRAGLRIGYGREPLHPDDLPPPSSPPAFPTSSETLSVVDSISDDVGERETLSDVDSIGDGVRTGDTLPSVSTAPAPSSGFGSNTSKIKENEVNGKYEDITKNDDSDGTESAKASSFSEKELLEIKSQIYDKLDGAREVVASVSAERKNAIRNRRQAYENVNRASLNHSELEMQLEEACEAEDFQRAERISENLSAAEKEKQAFMNILREADALIDALDLKMQQALESQIAAQEECAKLLEHFATNAASNADCTLKNAALTYSNEMDNWLSLSEAVEVKKMELEIESHCISESRGELDSTIEKSIQDDKREKEILCKRKDVLMEELEKLLVLVKQKENEIADNDANIKAVENKIANVVSGFEEIQSSIDLKYDNMQSVLSQVNLESKTLSLEKEEIDNFLIQEEETAAKLKELSRISEEEAKGYQEVVGLRKRLMLSALKSREDKVTLANNDEKLSENVKLLQLEASTARASLQELSSRKSINQQEIASLKQRIIFIDKRVPELEADKKVATAARNFKEAARIAAEVKSLNTEKEGIQIEMDTAIKNLEKLEVEIKDTPNKLQEAEEMILLKEKELAMARFERLLLIAGTSRAEQTSALEMGDVEEANLLLLEAKAAELEAEKLKSTYTFKEEDFTNVPKHFISMDLVSNLPQKQLQELAASLHVLSG
ncbi:hypothetical protein L6164_033153 [Bauhinia variegata]|uniref:Uncharacterized protein n=1 Tax=Bauhinia variegata TaxID=167791 RepID=A0ACB9KQX5_BAUVA|nr:hypothetical protein L6164_033153 [Bauhinia variegata]